MDLLLSLSDEKLWKLVTLGKVEKYSYGQLISEDIVKSSSVMFVCGVRSPSRLGLAGESTPDITSCGQKGGGYSTPNWQLLPH